MVDFTSSIVPDIVPQVPNPRFPMPNNSGLDLAGVGQSLTDFQKTLTDSLSDLGIQIGNATKATASQKQAIDKEAAGKVAEQAEVSRVGTLQDTQNSNAAASLGNDPNKTNYVMDEMRKDVLGQEQDLRNREKYIQAKADVKLTDDPMQWLVNQFTLPSDIMAYNIAEASKERLQADIKKATDMTQEAAKSNAIVTTADQATLLKAKTDQILAKAQIDSANADKAMVALGLNGLEIRRATNSAQFSAILQYQGLKVQNSTFDLALSKEEKERVDRDRTFALQKEWKTILEREKAENAAMDKAFNDKMKKATDLFQLPPISYKEYKQLPAARKLLVDKMMTSVDLQDRERFGASPVEAVEVATEVNGAYSPGVRFTMDKLNSIIAEGMQDPLIAAAKPDVRTALLNKKLQDELRRQSNNITPQGGLFSPPTLGAVFSTPMIKQLPIAKEIAPLYEKNPNKPLVADDLINVGMDMIAKGASPADVASQIAGVYMTANSINHTNYQYTKFGIAAPLENHKTLVHDASGLFSTGMNTVDMANIASVESTLTRMIIAVQRAKDQLQPLSWRGLQ